jgi:hypothetical protein
VDLWLSAAFFEARLIFVFRWSSWRRCFNQVWVCLADKMILDLRYIPVPVSLDQVLIFASKTDMSFYL